MKLKLFRNNLQIYTSSFFDHIIVVCRSISTLITVLPEFDKKAIFDGCMSKMLGIGDRFWISIDLRELSFCGPYGPCFVCIMYKIHDIVWISKPLSNVWTVIIFCCLIFVELICRLRLDDLMTVRQAESNCKMIW